MPTKTGKRIRRDPDGLPKLIIPRFDRNRPVPVKQRRVIATSKQRKLGELCVRKYAGGLYCDIVIRRNQPRVGKHWILLHEMLHLAFEHMKQDNYLKRQPGEKFVEGLTGRLFPMLAASGLWRGVTPAQLRRFRQWLVRLNRR